MVHMDRVLNDTFVMMIIILRNQQNDFKFDIQTLKVNSGSKSSSLDLLRFEEITVSLISS